MEFHHSLNNHNENYITKSYINQSPSIKEDNDIINGKVKLGTPTWVMLMLITDI